MAKGDKDATDPATPLMVKDEETGLMVNAESGLVPCTINVSEAGLGLRTGEVRGLSPKVAAQMIKLGTASPYL